MTTIRATCVQCGDVELRVADVTVRVCTDDASGSYAFRCPRCAMTTVKDAEARIVDLLTASGVRSVRWSLPAELSEHRPDHGPLTHDELLEFHERLHDAASLESAVRALAAHGA